MSGSCDISILLTICGLSEYPVPGGYLDYPIPIISGLSQISEFTWPVTGTVLPFVYVTAIVLIYNICGKDNFLAALIYYSK
jgi:hypothetical protein